jgi:exopolysaccharide production protein ExoQ
MKRFVSLAVVFYIIQALEALGGIGRLLYGEWAGQPGNKVTELSNLLLIVISIWLFFRVIFQMRGAGIALAIGAALFLCCSVVWSIDPQTTLRRGFIYLFVVMGAIGIAGSVSVDEFMVLLVRVCGISAIASVVLLLVSPNNALMIGDDDGAIVLRGIFSQKNVLGQAMAAGAIGALHCLRVRKRKSLRDIGALVLFTVVTLLSKSTTSLLIIFASIGVDVLVLLHNKRGATRTLSRALTIVIVPSGLLVLLFPDLFLELLGKDPTLTGRSELWAYVWTDIYQKPLLGWGYAAFWTPTNPLALEISATVKWNVPQAHNGVLEILINIGLIGLILFIFLLMRTIFLSLRCPARALAMSSLLCCGAIGILGVSETVLMEPFQITTSLFFIMGLMCEQASRVARRQRLSADRFETYGDPALRA